MFDRFSSAVSFRQGVNGYTNAFDTKIQPSSPNSDASKATTVFVFIGFSVPAFWVARPGACCPLRLTAVTLCHRQQP